MVMEGTVTEDLPGASFRVRLEETGSEVVAKIAGKLRKHHIRVLPGDHVTVEVSTYDPSQGRITFRRLARP